MALDINRGGDKKLILYHGTTLVNGIQIIKDGCIKANIARNYFDYDEKIKDSTDGYVYLTTNLYTAYYYGNINILEKKDDEDKYVYIFKMEIDDCELLPDYDEIILKTRKRFEKISFEESIRVCGCVRVKKDVKINKAEYVILPGTNNRLEEEQTLLICRELSKLQIQEGDAEKIIHSITKKYQWKSVN